ncbi:MAG: glycosyltransferase family 4 protein [Terriglobales bacterium]
MRRVVFVSDIFARGGASVWLRRLCQRLPAEGWACKLIIAEPAQPYDDDWSDWPCEREILRRHYSLRALVYSTADAIRTFSPHVVAVGAPWNTAALAMRYLYASYRHTARFVETVIVEHEGQYERLRGNTDIAVLVAACSDDAVSRIESDIPQLRGKVRRFWFPVPYGQRMQGKGGGRGQLRIAYLGRLDQRQKRVLDLPPLLDALATRGVDFTLTLIGDGADRAALERRLAMSCGRERVSLLGWLPSEKALEALAASDVQLLVSGYEGQPISTLEAMASGVVPVVTDLPGLRELIRDGTNGFLLPVGDIEAFASALARLATDRERLRRMARAARESVPERARMDVAVRDFSVLLAEAARAPLPTPKPVAYPPTRMDRLHVPLFMQELKRRCLGQSVY